MAEAKKKIINIKPAAHNKNIATELSASTQSDQNPVQPNEKEPADLIPGEEPKLDKVISTNIFKIMVSTT